MSDSDLWLQVAKVMGASNPTIVAGEVYCSFPCKPYVRFDPPNNPGDAWAMHQYALNMPEVEGVEIYWLDFNDRSKGCGCLFDTGYMKQVRAEGPDAVTALGRAIVEMGG